MATVINKNTLVLLRSVNTPDYSTSEWIINPDFSAAENVPKKYWKIENNNVVEMNASEKSVVDEQELEIIKENRLSQIDRKTQEIINRGFEFDGKTFSLSQMAQLNWNSLRTQMNSGSINPSQQIEVSTKDPDNDKYLLTTANRNAFFNTAFDKVYAILSAGRDLRHQVKTATTAEEVNSIVDDRV